MLTNHESIPWLLIIGAILIALIVICIVSKLFQVAIGLAILFFIIPIVANIFWGDGSSYVDEVTKYLSPSQQEQIQEGYEYYREKEREDPIIDFDRVQDGISDIKNDVQEKVNKLSDLTRDLLLDYLPR